MPAFQTVVSGDVMPPVPGAKDTRHLRGIQRLTAASARRELSGEAWRKALLVCGIASSLLYAVMIWAIRYEGYNPVSQVPSELTAIGAPTERLWALLAPIYTLLVAAFGWGIWRSAGRNRTVRVVGGLILTYASLGLLWPFAPMHQREVLAAGGGTLGDTMHVVLGGVTVFLMFLAIGFGAAAFAKRFRLYSIATIVVLYVRRVDVPRGSPFAGQSAHAVDRVVGAHQHQRVPAVGRGAGDRAVADRNIEGETSCLTHLRSRLLKVKPGSARPMTPR